jgi:D-glycerate 3-kinase
VEKRERAAGPLFSSLRAPDDSTWDEAARLIAQRLPGADARRVHWLTVPLLLWLLERRPRLVGLSAPQGSGKTTLTALLVELLGHFGVRALGVSIDDFYLAHDAQRALAAQHPGDPFLEHRGYPGTHDVALGAKVLAALRAGEPVEVPRYDKTAFGGRGDRAPSDGALTPPVDLVIVEGWLLGFTPAPAPPPELATVNTMLGAYRAWTAQLDLLVALRAATPESIVRWRVEAERVLSPADAEDYARRFLPAYALWADTVQADLRVELDDARLPRAP